MELVRAIFLGEAMLELSPADGDLWRLRHGGDTLNSAVHMSRLGIGTAFITALGSDDFSQRLRQDWASGGLDTDFVLTHPARTPGLYAISTDDKGERHFSYWRDNSAAREMFALPGMDSVLEKATQAELFGFSLISLAILPPEGRERLFDFCRAFRRRGGRVAYDSNYRPRLWPSPEAAAEAHGRAISLADIGLPTLEDETLLTGEGSARDVARFWSGHGCGEVVVKLGADGCLLPDGTLSPTTPHASPVDTSGAGDAFNAGYLFGRLKGYSAEASAGIGHRLAGWVVLHRGAIPARDPDFYRQLA